MKVYPCRTRHTSRPFLAIPGSGFRVQGSFKVQDSGCIQGSGFRVQGSAFRVQGSGFMGEGSQGVGLNFQGLGMRVWGFTQAVQSEDPDTTDRPVGNQERQFTWVALWGAGSALGR